MAVNGLFSRRRWSDGTTDGLDLSSTMNSQQAHVLAVDDSFVDRKVIERLLKISSCKVTAVDSGRRALQFLGLDDGERHSSVVDGLKIDLIITDYCMPGMTGYELLKKIKESSAFKETPVVIMSSENVLARIDRYDYAASSISFVPEIAGAVDSILVSTSLSSRAVHDYSCLEEGAEDFILKPVKLADVKRLKNYMMLREDRLKDGMDIRAASGGVVGLEGSGGINKRKSRDDGDAEFSSVAAVPLVSLQMAPRSSSPTPSDSPPPSSDSIFSDSSSSFDSSSSQSPLSSDPLSSAESSSSPSPVLDSPTQKIKLTVSDDDSKL